MAGIASKRLLETKPLGAECGEGSPPMPLPGMKRPC